MIFVDWDKCLVPYGNVKLDVNGEILGQGEKQVPGRLAGFPKPMTYQFLRLETRGPVAWIEYCNNPRNAVNWELLRELPQAIRSLDIDPAVRVVVIASGLEDCFSVGADTTNSSMVSIRPACAAGCSTVMTWCMRCAAHQSHCSQRSPGSRGCRLGRRRYPTATYVSQQIRHTLASPRSTSDCCPEFGATQALARLMGRHRAIRFLYEGTLVDAKEALSIGLVWTLSCRWRTFVKKCRRTEKCSPTGRKRRSQPSERRLRWAVVSRSMQDWNSSWKQRSNSPETTS